jgi:hypothetical protein
MERLLLFYCAMEDQHSSIEAYRAMRREAISAAFLARQTSPFGGQMRKAPRVNVRMPITLHLDEWEVDTQTCELSAGGCAFFASRVPSMSEFRFDLELQPSIVLGGLAQIVAAVPKDGVHYICLRFVNLSEDQKVALQDSVIAALLVK